MKKWLARTEAQVNELLSGIRGKDYFLWIDAMDLINEQFKDELKRFVDEAYGDENYDWSEYDEKRNELLSEHYEYLGIDDNGDDAYAPAIWTEQE